MTWLDICAAILILWAFLIVILLTDWFICIYQQYRDKY